MKSNSSSSLNNTQYNQCIYDIRPPYSYEEKNKTSSFSKFKSSISTKFSKFKKSFNNTSQNNHVSQNQFSNISTHQPSPLQNFETLQNLYNSGLPKSHTTTFNSYTRQYETQVNLKAGERLDWHNGQGWTSVTGPNTSTFTSFDKPSNFQKSKTNSNNRNNSFNSNNGNFRQPQYNNLFTPPMFTPNSSFFSNQYIPGMSINNNYNLANNGNFISINHNNSYNGNSFWAMDNGNSNFHSITSHGYSSIFINRGSGNGSYHVTSINNNRNNININNNNNNNNIHYFYS